MIKEVFTMAAKHITKARDYIHSLEETGKDLLPIIAQAIASGALRGVEMAKQSLFLIPEPQARLVPIKIDR